MGKLCGSFLIALTAFTTILPFSKWKSKKLSKFKKGLFSQYPFAVWFHVPLFCIPFALNFPSLLKFGLNKGEGNVKLNI